MKEKWKVKRGVYFTREGSKILRIGIPSKSRGQQWIWKLLESCKILPPFSEGLRENPPSLDKSIVVVAERQLDIAKDLGVSNLDIGFIGKDMIMESGYSLEILSMLGWGDCRVSLIVPPRSYSSKYMKIATKLPNITKMFLGEMGWEADIIEREGALEMAIKQGIADAIVDQVATGKTIASFGFREEEIIMESQFVLASNKDSLKNMRAEIEGIRTMVEGVNAARNKNLVAFNIPNKNLESLIKELPTCKSPTISRLASKNWSAVSTVVLDDSLRKTIVGIRNSGGEDILVTPVSVYLNEQKPRQTMKELYGKILDRKNNPVILSRTTRYLKDKNALANKFLGECKEFVEAIRSGRKKGKDGMIWEAADSLYFFLVLAAACTDTENVELDLNYTKSKSDLKTQKISELDYFLKTSNELVKQFEFCQREGFTGKRADEGDSAVEYVIEAIALQKCLNPWLASWKSLLRENKISEEEVELENGGRDKG